MKNPYLPDMDQLISAVSGYAEIERTFERECRRRDELMEEAHRFASGASGLAEFDGQLEKESLRRDDLLRHLSGPRIEGLGQSLTQSHFDALTKQVSEDSSRLVDHQLAMGLHLQVDAFTSKLAEQALQALQPLTYALEDARRAGALALPDALEEFRSSEAALAARVAEAYRLPWWHDFQIDALNTHVALSGVLADAGPVTGNTLYAVDSVLEESLIGFKSLRQATQFLEISGLWRTPRFRVLTRQDKQRRVSFLLRQSAPPSPVRKAHGLIHRHEKILRVMIENGMERIYGADWSRERLPLCDCKKLLGKTLGGDESILDHADCRHYADIMCHPDHFASLFSTGYEDIDDLRAMIQRLGQLRATASHARTFTVEDLRELTLLWRTMAKGFVELIDDVEMDF